MNKIELVKNQVYDILKKDNSGHDINHINRVLNLTLKFAEKEKANLELSSLIALLHDVDDYKLVGLENSKNLSNTRAIMKNANIDDITQEKIIEAISAMGYSNYLKGIRPISLEGMIVSDADMCDVVGVNGMLRVYDFCKSKNKPFFDRNMFPHEDLDVTNYINNKNESGICHYFEKVLKLKNIMLTKSGKEEIEKRHQITIDILNQFFEEEDAFEWKEFLKNYLKKMH